MHTTDDRDDRLPPHDDDDYVPTADEIEAAKAEIQSGWSEAERYRRAGYPSGALRPWEVPVIRRGSPD